MSAAPGPKPRTSEPASPEPTRPRGHLELVAPPPVPDEARDEARRVHDTRWLAALLVVVTAALFGAWTAALLGATESAWWPVAVGAVLAAVVALGVVVIRKTG